MGENSMQKVRIAEDAVQKSGYKSSAPVNYRPPTPVRVPPPPARGK